MDADGWRDSMDAEYNNHEVNGSWEWVRLDAVPHGRHLIKLVWVATNHNIADLFTKPLPFPVFAPMLAVVSGWAPYASL